MNEVANILDLKDARSAKKWLHNNSVSITNIGGKNVVSKFDFEFKRQQLQVEELRLSYPNNWFEIYDANTPDKAMVKSIRLLYPEKTSVTKSYKSNPNDNHIT